MTELAVESFVEECRAAISNDTTHKSALDVVQRAFSDPADVRNMIGEPTQGGIFPIHVADDLTIINVVWKPGMTLRPHNHEMWAIIGIYGGREDNIFWRRIKDDPNNIIEAAGAQSMGAGDVTPLGHNIIHSVTNPLSKLTGAIHVYGGNFFEIDRSEWDPETLVEQPYDIERAKAHFGG